MTIRFEQLESRDPAATSIQWVFAPDLWLLEREETIRAAGDSLAVRLTRPGTETYRIEVQASPQPGAVADAYSVYEPNAIYPHAGVIRFDTGRTWDRQFDLFRVAQHEAAHALGVDEHNPSPGSLMYEFAPYVGEPRRLNHTDVPLFERAGWDVKPETSFPDRDYIRVWGVGVQDGDTTPDGWAYMERELALAAYPGHVLGPDRAGDSWALWPAGTML